MLGISFGEIMLTGATSFFTLVSLIVASGVLHRQSRRLTVPKAIVIIAVVGALAWYAIESNMYDHMRMCAIVVLLNLPYIVVRVYTHRRIGDIILAVLTVLYFVVFIIVAYRITESLNW
jgi:hypothetical protein